MIKMNFIKKLYNGFLFATFLMVKYHTGNQNLEENELFRK